MSRAGFCGFGVARACACDPAAPYGELRAGKPILSDALAHVSSADYADPSINVVAQVEMTEKGVPFNFRKVAAEHPWVETTKLVVKVIWHLRIFASDLLTIIAAGPAGETPR